MNMDDVRIFAPLAKATEQDDGTLTVEGFASTESVDKAGEIVTAAAIEAALPEFFQNGSGPLREMHQLKAAGRVDKALVDSKKRTWIRATVVDPLAIKKILARVYNGLSIGGKTLARDRKNPKVITKLRLDEVSLVDTPANPDALFEIVKASNAQRDSLKSTIVKDALASMSADDRAMAVTKAALQFPRDVNASLGVLS
jgi:hypothetical protein